MQTYQFFLLGLVSLLLSACSTQPATPLSVTESFWQAVKEKDVSEIEALSLPNSLPVELDEENVLAITSASFGRIIIDGSKAEVETRVTVASDQPVTLPINTLLIEDENGWKVDYRATVSAIDTQSPISELLRELKIFGEEFSQQFDQSINELDQAMPEIQREIDRMGETFKERVPELKQQFEDLAEELQQAIEEALEDQQFESETPAEGEPKTI